MTDRELMQQALETLEWHLEKGAWGADIEGVTAALRERLAQPEQKHEAWCASLTQLLLINPPKPAPCNCKTKLPEPQPQRQWQGLTDVEVGALTVFDGLHHVEVPVLADFVRAVEAKIKEKNQ